ncbi:MAG: hypothetical protein M1327_04630 [Candidatus Thermoplasmatota archaeon]|nr:hypothetical protein [Candidatus Thermoplasmatota archaeon]
MAKDKDQEIFVEPEFIEKDFLQSEKERAKSTIVVFLIAAALGLFSGYLFILGIWYVGLLLMFLLVISFKRVIQALHLRMPQRGSQVFILVMVFILTWIIFWTISLNPPISSVGGPQVSTFQVYDAHTSSWTSLTESNGQYHYSITQNGVLSLRVYVSYITPISNVSITVSTGGLTATPLSINYFDNYAYFNQSVVPALYVFNVDVTIHGTSYVSPLQVQILSA